MGAMMPESDIYDMSFNSCSSSTILNSSHNSISESSSSFSCVSLCSFDRNGMSSARSSISCDRPPISLSWNANKPHKANDAAWEAIRALRCQDGLIGLNHFKLLRRIGSGDIGKVYMCQLKGLQHCVYAMKVVDKDALAHRNKLHRAEVEKQILATLDHPFLPTLYAHFDASHYSCLVMEFCSGGDLHSLRQRQHSKRFYLPSASALLSQLLKNKADSNSTKEQELTEEYELVQQALFTDSEDQSGWFYHMWLLGQTLASNGPKLVATWPFLGSNLIIDSYLQSHAYVTTFDTPFGTDHCIHSEGIPVILHFSEQVKGVNDSTVRIESPLVERQSVIWRPLSTHRLQAKTWVTLLSFPSTSFETGNSHTVQVTVGDTPGIISSNGYMYTSPIVLNFSLDLRSVATEYLEGDLERVAASWDGERFSPVNVDWHSTKFPVEVQSDNLSIDGNFHTQGSSKWQQETLEREVKLCRELLEIEMDCKLAKLTLARLLMAEDVLSNDSSFGTKRIHTFCNCLMT